jgi:hypothetical protein
MNAGTFRCRAPALCQDAQSRAETRAADGWASTSSMMRCTLLIPLSNVAIETAGLFQGITLPPPPSLPTLFRRDEPTIGSVGPRPLLIHSRLTAKHVRNVKQLISAPSFWHAILLHTRNLNELRRTRNMVFRLTRSGILSPPAPEKKPPLQVEDWRDGFFAA